MLRCSILLIGDREPHFLHVQRKKGYGGNKCLILAFRVLPLHSSSAQGHSTVQRHRCLEAILYVTGSFVAKGQDLKCLHRQKGNALQFALQIKHFHLLYDNPVQNHPPVCCRRYAAVCHKLLHMLRDVRRPQRGRGRLWVS